MALGDNFLTDLTNIAGLAGMFTSAKDKGSISWGAAERNTGQAEAFAPRLNKLDADRMAYMTKPTGDFLKGMAEPQAEAYNTYQNATYSADTSRQIGRIQETGAALGMSPWEIMGQGGAAPLPSPTLNSPQAPGASRATDYMASMIPLKTAQLQAKTALAQTAIQSATTREVAETQAKTARDVANTNTANGALPLSQVMETMARTDESRARTIQQAAQTLNTHASTLNIKALTEKVGDERKYLKEQVQESKTRQDLNVMNTVTGWDRQSLAAFETILKTLPTETITAGPYSTNVKTGWRELAEIAANSAGTNDARSAMQAKIAKMPQDTVQTFWQIFKDLGSALGIKKEEPAWTTGGRQ
ncbi:MAG: hypothetical protein [Arizlama microvirus]|nr:MAG: hypothetical protein [Arizlama microvirus]